MALPKKEAERRGQRGQLTIDGHKPPVGDRGVQTYRRQKSMPLLMAFPFIRRASPLPWRQVRHAARATHRPGGANLAPSSVA